MSDQKSDMHCRKCTRNVVWREGQGWCHIIDEETIFTLNDTTGHEATTPEGFDW